MPTTQTQDTTTEPRNQRRNRKWSNLLPAVIFLGAAMFTFFRSQSYHPPAHVLLANLELQRLDGARIEPSQLRGKPIILNFWAPWCGPCRLEMPWLQNLQKKHPDILVIGVEADPAEYANGIILAADKQISFPLLRMTDSLRDAVGEPGTLPTTIYIDASGKVVHSISGITPEPLMVKFANDTLQPH